MPPALVAQASACVWLAFLLTTGACADDVVPVGIILDADNSQIQVPGTETWFTAAPGWELLPGYRLKTSSGTIRFAFCPDHAIRTLLPRQELTVPPSHLPDLPALARDSQPAASCDLPAIPAKPLASVRGGRESDLPPPSPAGSKANLLDTISVARSLEHAGDVKGAATQYARLETDYPEAVWTRGVMQRLAATPKVSAAEGKTFALVVGISDYPPETPQGSLQYADADARAFADFLQKPKGGAVPTDQIRLLLNREGTRDRIDSAISTFVESAADKQNTLIVFIAAHGDYLVSEKDPATGQIIEREPYIVTADSNGQDVKTSGFPMAEFRNLIAEQALRFKRVIVYLDVCHAGYIRDVEAEKGLESAVKRVFIARQGELGVMLASDARGFAYEAEQFGRHGAFTYYVLDGLNGGAARKPDPTITFADLFRYVLNGVGELTNNAQTPDRFATDLQMAVLDDVTMEPGISLPKATPLPESATRRRRGSSALPPGTSAAGPAAIPGQANQGEERRIALEENGQRILVQYLRGEQAQPTRAAFDLCARDFEEALNLAPLSTFDESRMWFCKGRSLIFEKTGSGYRQAAQLLERAIRLDPTRAYAYNALGIAYLEQVGQHPDYYDRAVDAFHDAVRFAPNWAYPLHNLALADSERGDFVAAIQSYRRAMTLAPAYSYLPYNLGLLNQRMNRLDEAKSMYQVALRTAEGARRSGVSPRETHWTERSRVLNALGTVEAARRHREAAQKLYEAALVDDPEFGPARHNLAVLLSRKGQSTRAEQLWRQNIAADPGDLASRAALAQYLEKYGTADDAIRVYKEAIDIAPDYLGARRQLAKLFVAKNQWPEAFEQIDSARAQSPSNPAILEEFADIAVHSNHIAEAENAYRDAASLTEDKHDRRRLEAKAREFTEPRP